MVISLNSQAFPSVCVHNIEYKEVEDQRKAGKAWEHSSHEWPQVDVRWTWVGGANIQICTHWTWNQVSYWSRRSSFDHAGVQNCSRAFKQMILCIVLAVGPLPSMFTSHPTDIIHMMSTPRPSPFCAGLPLRVLLQMQTEGKNRGGLGTRLHGYAANRKLEHCAAIIVREKRKKSAG